MSYVIFKEVEITEDDGTTRDLLTFIHLSNAGILPTALRSHATEYATPRAAYDAAGKFPGLADWRVGAR